jgi:hypothetical protein
VGFMSYSGGGPVQTSHSLGTHMAKDSGHVSKLPFPDGDTLGVVFSFLSAYDLLRGGLFRVCKAWYRILCELPHAWGNELDLRWPRGRVTHTSSFAWNHVKVSELVCVQICFPIVVACTETQVGRETRVD